MAGLPILALTDRVRPFIEGRLPRGVEVRWIAEDEQPDAKTRGAQICWLDLFPLGRIRPAVTAATDLQWLNTMFAGIDSFPVELLQQRGVVMTNGAGVHSVAISEYALAGMLALAKHLPDVVRAHDRHEWAEAVPATNLHDAEVLVIGLGSIGRAIAAQLRGFGARVTGVRRNPEGEAGVIGIDAWRDQLGAFDWVVLAAPGTRDTARMIGAAELGAMKPGARLVNIARGTLVDQDALIAALASGHLAGAFLDTVDPEPLPPEHPLWDAPNTLITMHLSGRSQTGQAERAARLFLANLDRWLAGQPLVNQVDLALGY